MGKHVVSYPLRSADTQRQSTRVPHDQKPDHTRDQPVLEGSANWERIDAAVRKAGLTTTELAKRTGVTFAAAARWRKPKGKGGSEASGEHLRAIAEACGVTVDQLLRVYDGYDPPFASWLAFKGTQTYRRLSPEQVKAVAATPWADGTEPTLASWLAVAEGHLAASHAS